MSRFIKEKSFYISVLAITLPIALQNLITMGVSMMDTIMLGKLGEVQITASAQANQPQFVFMLLTFGLAGGGSVLASQYWGQKNIKAVNEVIGIVIRIAIIASVLLSVVILLFPRQIMAIYLKPGIEMDEAVKYLKIVGYSYFFFGITNTFICVIRSVELVRVSILVSSISFVVNVFLNWVFIFGNLGAPALGIQGAAIGTLSARIVEFIVISIYALFIDKRLQFKLKFIFSKNPTMFKDYMRFSLPVVANELAWACGISLQAAILGHLNNEIVSANAIASVLQQLSTIIIFGVANAACVIVGKKIGEGDKLEAKRSAFTIMIWSVILGIFSSIMVFVTRKSFVSLYDVTETTRVLTENLMILTSVIVFFVSISGISIVGVLRGAGDTKFGFKLEMVALWLVAVPLGLISGFILKGPILLTYALLKIDEPIKSVIAFIRTTKDKTYKSVTRNNAE